MSIPDFNSDISPYNLGVSPNNSDDDAEILDNLVEQDATPPEPEDIPRFDMPPVPKVEIPPIQRMVVRSYNLTLNVPYLIAQANPWRERVMLSVDTGNATDIAFAPSSTEVQSMSTAYLSRFNIYGDLDISYNGELWAMLLTADPIPRLSVIEIISKEAGR